MRKLIALDLDGTLLNSKKEISEANVQAIKKAQEQGHIIVPSSGRSPKGIESLFEKYGLNCPIIGDNGTIIYAEGKIIHIASLSRQQAGRICLELDREDVPYKMSTDKGSMGPENWKQRFERIMSSGRVPTEYIEDPDFEMMTHAPQDIGQPVFKHFEEIVDNEEYKVLKFLITPFIPEVKERLRKNLESIEGVIITSSSSFNLEASSIDGNKGNGIRILANYYNIPIENTVAIGDEMNDVPMFEAAGLSIAMENSSEDVKKRSDMVTLTNDEDGVAYAFEKYIF